MKNPIHLVNARKWERVRRVGPVRFILLVALGWALGMGVVFVAGELMRDIPGALNRVLIGTAGFFVGGGFFGALLWIVYEESYRAQRGPR